MTKRLTNALRDAGLDNSRVDKLIQWLDLARRFEKDALHNGAKAIYRLTQRVGASHWPMDDTLSPHTN